MSWPKYEKIGCVGFDRKYLPALERAMSTGLVDWGMNSSIYNSSIVYFSFAGYKWSLQSKEEIVMEICLEDGPLEPEVLTAAMLGAKIEAR